MSDLTNEQQLAELMKTPEYQGTHARYTSKSWRLDNIYKIQNKDGDEVIFKRNDAQIDFCANMHLRNVILKARQLGFSTLIDIWMLDTCLWRTNTACGIIDETLENARKKLKKILFAYERLPPEIRDGCPTTRAHADEIAWSNGSSIRVGTSHRGGTLQILHVSEYGKIAVDKPEVAREIKTGAFPAVPLNGRLFVESTAHGTAGAFHDMVRQAEALKATGRPINNLDIRMHFYGWMWDRDYRMPMNMALIEQEQREYFEELKLKHGIQIDGEQAAWYVSQLKSLGPDDMKSEFPSTADEAFFNSLEGAYFKREMSRARKDGRVGGMIPFDPSRRVNTAWDIGEDMTAIVFHQTDGVRHRIIDYWEAPGESLQHAVSIVHEKKAARGFIYEKHYGPHDIENKDWGDNSRTRKQQALALGVDFTVVPRVSQKADSIEAFRRMLNLTWIDQEHAGRFVECLDNYRKRWNNSLGQWMAEPLHDWASHGSDAGQQLAMGFEPNKPERDNRPRERRPASAWAS